MDKDQSRRGAHEDDDDLELKLALARAKAHAAQNSDEKRYPRTSEIGAPAAIFDRAFMTLPGIPPPTTPTTTPSRS